MLSLDYLGVLKLYFSYTEVYRLWDFVIFVRPMSYFRIYGDVVRMCCLENVFMLYSVVLSCADRIVGDPMYDGFIIWLLKRFFSD